MRALGGRQKRGGIPALLFLALVASRAVVRCALTALPHGGWGVPSETEETAAAAARLPYELRADIELAVNTHVISMGGGVDTEALIEELAWALSSAHGRYLAEVAPPPAVPATTAAPDPAAPVVPPVEPPVPPGHNHKYGKCPSDEGDFLKLEGLVPNVIMASVCVVCAALAAGLTMGLVSIEPLEMAIKQRSGTPEERRMAGNILPLVTRHHWMLVTLLVFNSLANEALPIFLDNLLPAFVAVIMSVTLVLFFGEILPSAIFTGPAQLYMASKLSMLVWFLMMVFSPISWPIAKLLDYVLGIEVKRYNRAELAALVEIHGDLSQHEDQEDPLHADEVAIVNGVLQTSEKSVADAMLTMDKVFCLSMDARLDEGTMADIIAAGFSRILIYDGNTRNIRGYLQVKRLIIISPEDKRVIRSLALRKPVIVSPHQSLLEVLNIFQQGQSHLAVVSHSPQLTTEAMRHGLTLEGAALPVGIITLEDIIEEIIQEEIYDESDHLSAYIERRARETLLKYTRRKVINRRIGRASAITSSSISRRAGDPMEKALIRKLSKSLHGDDARWAAAQRESGALARALASYHQRKGSRSVGDESKSNSQNQPLLGNKSLSPARDDGSGDGTNRAQRYL